MMHSFDARGVRTVSVDRHDGRVRIVVALGGELNTHNATDSVVALTNLVDAAVPDAASGSAESPPPLVALDLSELELLSAAGVRVLVTVIEYCARRGLAAQLIAPHGGVVRRVVEVSKIAERVPVTIAPDRGFPTH